MSDVKIIQKGDPVLREIASPVPISDIQTPKIQKIMEDMKIALAREEDGIAIAAPQIGVSLQIFVVSGAILKAADENYKGSEDFLIYINPQISKLSRKKNEVEEGCLSVRWLYGKIKRSEKATIKAYNEKGELFERGASGLLAQVFQHEVDHLNGILFIDSAYNVQEVLPEHLKKDSSKTDDGK